MPTQTKSSYQDLLNHLADTKDAKQIEKLLKALLTDKEQLEIANRIRIFDLLDKGLTQRDIAQQLGVGIATVSRGAKTMQQHDVSDLLTTLKKSNKS